jgi:hypothetical protein
VRKLYSSSTRFRPRLILDCTRNPEAAMSNISVPGLYASYWIPTTAISAAREAKSGRPSCGVWIAHRIRTGNVKGIYGDISGTWWIPAILTKVMMNLDTRFFKR